MDNDRYIWCRNCATIHHVTPFDRAPRYRRRLDEFVEEAANDWREFINRHAGHRLEPMVATNNDYYPDGSSFDPMRVRFLEISNGNETLLVRRSRGSIEEPFRYSVVDGRLIESGATLGVQEAAIRREMKLHFSWAPAAPFNDEQIDRFLGLLREVARSLDPDQTPGTAYAGPDEIVAYCALDDVTVAALMAKCGRSFQWNELESLRRFVDAHRQADDVLALVKRRTITVETSFQRGAGPALRS